MTSTSTLDEFTVEKLPLPQHSFAFRSRRAVNWLTLGITYSTMYMGRYNLSFVNKQLSDTYGWSKTDIGFIISAALVVYGFSAVMNGLIADRIGGRKAMLIGVCGSVVFNLLFGLGTYGGAWNRGSLLLIYFASMWALNSYFQSFGAVSLIKVNSGWFALQERGVFSAVFGSMIQLGRTLVYVVGPMLVILLNWRWIFFVPAALMLIMAILTYLFVQDRPEDVGLSHSTLSKSVVSDGTKTTLREVLKKVFMHPVTVTIAAAEFCTGFVRHGFEQWFPRYMQEVQHLPLSSKIFQSGGLAIVIAGIAGAFVAGTLSDWVFSSRRTPVAFVGYALQIISLSVVWRAPSFTAVVAAFVVNSFAISMVHSMLSGTASMDFGGRKAAATAAGFFDGMQYLGGAAVGMGLGALLDHFGWIVWGPSMLGFSAIGAILMATLWNARPQTN